MANSALVYLVPLLLTPVIAGAIRMFGGPERGARVAGIAVMIAFAFGWVLIVRPSWAPVDDISRIGHIALGASVLGLLLDLIGARRILIALATAGTVLVCAWSSYTDTLAVPAMDGPLLPVAVLAVVAFVILMRLDAVKAEGMSTLILLAMAALGISFMAQVVEDATLATSALVLALTVLGFTLPQSIAALPVGSSIILGGGSVLLAIAWALAHNHPETRLALLLVPMIFFAEGTAKRVPLPEARISTLLYPALLAVLAALPLVLAVLVTYATANMVTE